VTVRTLFHKTKVDFQKWFFAIIKNDLTARQLAFEISVTKDTANFMINRIRVAAKSSDTVKRIKEQI
jgi:hypothetical protein